MPLPENKVAKGETYIEVSQDTGVLGQIGLDQLKFLQRITGSNSQINHSLLTLVDMFSEFFEKQKFLLDAQKEKKDAKDVSGAVKQKDKLLPDGIEFPKFALFKKMFLVALAAYAFDVDKYIRTLMFADTIKNLKLGIGGGLAKFFSRIGNAIKGFRLAGAKDFNVRKVFGKEVDNAVKVMRRVTARLTAPFKNFALGWRTLGNSTKGVDKQVKFFTTGAAKAGVHARELVNIIKGIVKGIGGLGLKALRGVMIGFRGAWRLFKVAMFPAIAIFKSIRGVLAATADAMKGTKALAPVAKTIGSFGGLFRGIFGALKFVAGRVLMPLFAVFDLVTGFIEGFKLQGEDDTRGTLERIFDGLTSGILKAIKGIFIIPLDMLTNLVSWAAEKLGFDGVAKFLDDKVSFEGLFNFYVDFFKNLWSPEPQEGFFSITKFIMNMIKAIPKAIDEIKQEGIGPWLARKIKEIMKFIKDKLTGYLTFWKDDDAVGDTTKDVKEMEDKNISLQIRKLQKANASEEDKKRVEELKAEIERRKNLKEVPIEPTTINKQTNEVANLQKQNADRQASNNNSPVISDSSTNAVDQSVTNVNNNSFAGGSPSVKADMADNPMFAWRTA